MALATLTRSQRTLPTSAHNPIAPDSHPDATGTPVALGAITALTYCFLALSRHEHLETGMDLTIFAQALDHLSRGEAPLSEVKGFPIWGDHFHPMVAALAPLWHLWPDPRCLLVVQALAGGIAVGMLARTGIQVTRRRAGAVVGLLLAVSPGFQSGMLYDFHEVALALPLLAAALDAYLHDRGWAVVGWGLALPLVKEDMPFLVAGIAVALAARGQWRPAISLLAGAALWLGIVIGIVLPALHPGHAYSYAAKTKSPFHSLWTSLVTDGRATTATLILLCGTGFLALRSPLAAAFAIPAATRFAADTPNYWGLSFHYTLLAEVVLAYAALDGWCRLPWRSSTRAAGRRLAIIVASAAAAGSATAFGAGAEAFAASGEAARRVAAVRAAVAGLPPGTRVLTESRLSPHTVPRLRAGLLPGPDRRPEEPGQSWLLLDLRSEHVNRRWVTEQVAAARTEGRLRESGFGVVVIAPAKQP